VWLDPFVIREHPVTNTEFLQFLNDVPEGRASAWVPRELGSHTVQGVEGASIYGRDDSGRWALVPDKDGDLWNPEWPVVLVTWRAARAYADWLAMRTGLPWRLPSELEWEKAARGVDGRHFPWGDHLDPAFCNVRGSLTGRPLPCPVDRFELDVSPYGMRGAAGNVRDWCSDGFTAGGPDIVGGRHRESAEEPAARVIRGGCWLGAEVNTRLCYRIGNTVDHRVETTGFRVCRSA
jgi:serine/threonine-protein kinase